jgi:hypothetical protein
MSKLFQALLSGIFFTYFIDFFLFLGVKINYIDFFKIDIYYNILFADSQNIYIFTLFSLLIGYITIYIRSIFIKVFVVGGLFILSLSTLIAPIGYSIGEKLFMKKNVTLHDKKYNFIGNIRYIKRDGIIFYDKELKKQIILKKSLLKAL